MTLTLTTNEPVDFSIQSRGKSPVPKKEGEPKPPANQPEAKKTDAPAADKPAAPKAPAPKTPAPKPAKPAAANIGSKVDDFFAKPANRGAIITIAALSVLGLIGYAIHTIIENNKNRVSSSLAKKVPSYPNDYYRVAATMNRYLHQNTGLRREITAEDLLDVNDKKLILKHEGKHFVYLAHDPATNQVALYHYQREVDPGNSNSAKGLRFSYFSFDLDATGLDPKKASGGNQDLNDDVAKYEYKLGYIPNFAGPKNPVEKDNQAMDWLMNKPPLPEHKEFNDFLSRVESQFNGTRSTNYESNITKTQHGAMVKDIDQFQLPMNDLPPGVDPT